MMTFFNILDKIIGIVSRWIAIVGITGGVLLAFVNVVARYGFNYSITWAAELTVYLFLWSMFFAVAYVFKLGEHISIGLLVESINKKAAKYMILFTYTVTFIFLSAVSYYGYEYLQLVIELEEMSVDLEIAMWIPYLVIPVSFALSAYRVGEHFIQLVQLPYEEIKFKNEAAELMKEVNTEEILKEAQKKSGGLV